MSPCLTIMPSMRKLTYSSLFFGSALVRYQHHCGCVRAFRPSSTFAGFGNKLHWDQQQERLAAVIEGSNSGGRRDCNTARYLSSTSTTSNFQAPEPPQSKGQAVYTDIDISSISAAASESSTSRNNDPNAVFVVSGASRGIGLEFVKTLSKRTKGTILACCRNPDSADELQKVESSLPSGRIQVIQLDLEDQDSINEAVEEIKSKYQRIDILLNVAGLLGDGGKTTAGPERSIAKIDRDWMEKTFAVNLYGPIMFSQGLVPLMSQRRTRKKDTPTDSRQRPNSIIANLSARVGSISDNNLGGWYSYRMSKAALNQATRTMANELKRQNVFCVSLHPGTTDTDLSKPFQSNVAKERLFPVEFTVDQLLKVIDSMDDTNSGGLYDWAGKAIPF